ncbi:MAG: hypothetical protein EXR21_03505 [Flavobacteriaceae bacterium]|nr:hypothetical protein [Flavobacteriaceae bacterium]
MLRTFIGNLTLLIVANLLVKPFWVFGIDLQVQNQVGIETYGMYAALFNFTLLPTMLLDLGINQLNVTSIAREPQKASRLVATLLPAKLILGILYMFVVIGSGWLIGDAAYSSILLLLLAANQVLAGLVVYLRSTLSGLHHFRTDTLLSITDKLLMVFFCGTILYSGSFPAMRIEWFVYAQTLAYVLTLLLSYILARRKVGRFSFKIDLSSLLNSLKSSFPYALLTLLMAIYTWSDMLMLERLLPDGKLQSGMYAQAYRLFDALNMVAVLAASLLLPMFARMLHQKTGVDKLVRTSSIMLIFPAMCLALFSFFYAYEIIDLIYVSFTLESVIVFRLLMFAFVAMCCNYIFSTLLTANGNISILIRISAAAVVLNIGLKLFLIPEYKTIGAAFSAMCTFGFVSLLNIIVCLAKKIIRVNGKLLLRICLVLTLLSALLFKLKTDKFSLATSFYVSVPITVFLVFILSIVSRKEIKYFFNKPDLP